MDASDNPAHISLGYREIHRHCPQRENRTVDSEGHLEGGGYRDMGEASLGRVLLSVVGDVAWWLWTQHASTLARFLPHGRRASSLSVGSLFFFW